MSRTALLLILTNFAWLPLSYGQGFSGVLTWHNDNSRTGQNLSESILSPQNVNALNFGKLVSYLVDGSIFAQPLYVPNVSIAGKGVYNVVYVATENDSVYAFDANGVVSTPLWQVSFINPSNGITVPSCPSSTAECAVYPIHGITGTPVIDTSTSTMYLVTVTVENGAYVQRLHALDLGSGAEKFGGPVVVQASIAGTGSGNVGGTLSFDSEGTLQRTGLLLSGGTLYIAWGIWDQSGAVTAPGHGWILAYNPQTLVQIATFNPTRDGYLGGVWQSGAGLAADSVGNIYAAIGDGSFDANNGGRDYGDSVVKLNSQLQVVDYFTPMDQLCRYDYDLDLGSAGPMLLPAQTGPYPDELMIAGKGGNPCDLFGSVYATPVYLVNGDALGGYSSSQNTSLETIAGSAIGYWSSPAYWQGSGGAWVYLAGMNGKSGIGDYLKMYSISQGVLSATPLKQSVNVFPVGSTPSISANGTNNGIVWAIARQDPLYSKPGLHAAVLYAYNAADVSQILYNSTQAGSRDQAGAATKFQTPTIANGKVYVGTQTELDVYGLFSQPVPPSVTLSVSKIPFPVELVGTTSAAKTVTLTNHGANVTSIAITGVNSADFAQSNTCGNPVPAWTTCKINITFTPTAPYGRTAYLAVMDNASNSPQTVSLSGTGTVVGLSATSVNFGNQNVGTTSTPMTVTMTNHGSFLLTISGMVIGGTNAGDFAFTSSPAPCGSSLAAGASCSITITFTPTAAGTRIATLKVSDNGGGSPQKVSLSGTGQ